MPLPAPKPGLVIGYSYLWRQQAAAGETEGRKTRPCAIILAVDDEEGRKSVIVLPITHVAPQRETDAVEIPAVTKQRLGLDNSRSWIVVTEGNRFIWPGPDLRPVEPGGTRFEYGFLPPRLFNQVRETFLRQWPVSGSKPVDRTE